MDDQTKAMVDNAATIYWVYDNSPYVSLKNEVEQKKWGYFHIQRLRYGPHPQEGGKIVDYLYRTDITPYEEGDIWSAGSLLYQIRYNVSGSFSNTDTRAAEIVLKYFPEEAPASLKNVVDEGTLNFDVIFPDAPTDIGQTTTPKGLNLYLKIPYSAGADMSGYMEAINTKISPMGWTANFMGWKGDVAQFELIENGSMAAVLVIAAIVGVLLITGVITTGWITTTLSNNAITRKITDFKEMLLNTAQNTDDPQVKEMALELAKGPLPETDGSIWDGVGDFFEDPKTKTAILTGGAAAALAVVAALVLTRR